MKSVISHNSRQPLVTEFLLKLMYELMGKWGERSVKKHKLTFHSSYPSMTYTMKEDFLRTFLSEIWKVSWARVKFGTYSLRGSRIKFSNLNFHPINSEFRSYKRGLSLIRSNIPLEQAYLRTYLRKNLFDYS